MKTWSLAIVFCVVCWVVISGCEKNKEDGGTEVGNIPAHALNTPADLDSLLQQIGDARIVMLGEASHGTHEFYAWRTAISQRLIAEKGFDMIAVEGEWADSYRVNQFVQGPAKDSLQAVALLGQYDRWPTWMWGNREVASLVTWMNRHNQGQPAGNRAGFFGLDVYCLWESMQELMPYVQGNESLQAMATQVHQCFRPFSADPMQYAYAVSEADANCRTQTEKLYEAVMQQTGNKTATTEAQFVLQQNALVALNGERYYRTATASYPGSWNIRDQHMQQTLERLLEWKGPEAKIIVWAHNTHVGDARYTDMAAGGMVNLGQLAREKYGADQVYIVGFGTYSGRVIASNNWGGTIQTMRVPQARKNSWEALLHAGGGNKLVFSSELTTAGLVQDPIGHRAIGVQYDPANEAGNYVPSVIPKRYDAFIFIDQTTALQPLNTPVRNEPPDTYPSGY
ncbi:Erythromycin esterase homolog [Cnuella takakiae]|uniref:Erythromycin esterase homolog n=1 Tax=Cnuella takakiae TaxID=1302690 RepID=A0A1M5ABD7_9BACT|nr:erythromycin esterase family protein [Cnuella takakiae]SHF27608.1 Erythromycin esterase homolog [Cnuella takakiae]